ncbi:hypothetical protein [Nitrospira sp. Nam80]
MRQLHPGVVGLFISMLDSESPRSGGESAGISGDLQETSLEELAHNWQEQPTMNYAAAAVMFMVIAPGAGCFHSPSKSRWSLTFAGAWTPSSPLLRSQASGPPGW